MADALGSVIVIISALIMWFLPYQVFTSVSIVINIFYFQEEKEEGVFVDLPDGQNQWTK